MPSNMTCDCPTECEGPPFLSPSRFVPYRRVLPHWQGQELSNCYRRDAVDWPFDPTRNVLTSMAIRTGHNERGGSMAITKVHMAASVQQYLDHLRVPILARQRKCPLVTHIRASVQQVLYNAGPAHLSGPGERSVSILGLNVHLGTLL